MVKLKAYDTATGHVDTLHTWVKRHRAWSHAYRMLCRATASDHNSETIYYLSEV